MTDLLQETTWVAPSLDEVEEEEIVYPDSDGMGMPDGDPQREAMFDVLKILEEHFKDDSDVYITGNSFVYYIEGDPTMVFSPDVMVVKGVEKRLRDYYKFWEEANRPPTFVMEIATKTTYKKDLGRNMHLYRMLGISEYFLFDYTGGRYFKPPLQAYRLVRGNWVSIAISNVAQSEALGIEFRFMDGELRLLNAKTGERLLAPQHALREVRLKLAEAEGARYEAETHAAQEAEARRKAEARAAELTAELERLRAGRN